MMDRLRQDLNCAQRLVLTSAAAILVMGLGSAFMASAQTPAAPLPHFTAASVKPSAPREHTTPWQHDPGFWSAPRNHVAREISYAYEMGMLDIQGLPPWAKSNFYDFEARMPAGASDAQFRLMMRGLLADRFQMQAHTELRPEAASILTAAADGPDRRPASPSCQATPQHPSGTFGTVTMTASVWIMAGCDVTMADIAHYFTVFTAPNRVADETGLSGHYDVHVTVNVPPPPADAPIAVKKQNRQLAVKRAFLQQLGLNLDLTRTEQHPMPVLVIDHIAPPSAN